MKQKSRILALLVLMAMLFSFTSCDTLDRLLGTTSAAVDITDGGTSVHFIDCGQGDSTLFVSDGAVTLVDAGPGSNADDVVRYIQNLGITKIDHLIFTHPHEDHIGGGYDVLNNFTVHNIYMKKPTAGTTPTTAVYENLLEKISSLGMTVNAVTPESTFTCGNLIFTFLGPLKDYEDLNDQSVCLTASIGEIRFLITGDAEREPEEDLLAQYGKELSCTVFKAAHHGSSTSNSEAFVEAVSPDYAVISCGLDNSYNHPHSETIETFEKLSVTTYRTDQDGSVVFETDGQTISGKAEKAA